MVWRDTNKIIYTQTHHHRIEPLLWLGFLVYLPIQPTQCNGNISAVVIEVPLLDAYIYERHTKMNIGPEELFHVNFCFDFFVFLVFFFFFIFELKTEIWPRWSVRSSVQESRLNARGREQQHQQCIEYRTNERKKRDGSS